MVDGIGFLNISMAAGLRGIIMNECIRWVVWPDSVDGENVKTDICAVCFGQVEKKMQPTFYKDIKNV